MWNDERDGSKPFYHIPANHLIYRFGDKFKNSYSFSVIRHPYDLILSWYNEHRKERYEAPVREFYDISLEEWIKRGCPTHWKGLHFNPLHQYKWVCDGNNNIIVSKLIRMENYENDFNEVYHNIKAYLPSNVTNESIRSTRRNESCSKNQLTVNMKEGIYELFKEDFRVFGYKK
jgi:hypothetical protein